MKYFGFSDFIPIWLMFPLTVVLVMFAVEVGYRLAQYRLEHAEREGTLGSLVAASLGLLAFFLGFTFSLAAARFDARREILLEEANAIGTCYLRTSFLPEPQQTEIRKLLRKYVDIRLAVVRTHKFDEVIRESESLQNSMWDSAIAAGADTQKMVVYGLFIQSLNEVIDMHSKRILVSLQSRLPDVIWIVLYVVSILGMGVIGYQGGLSSRERPLAILPLAIAFAMVIMLIADLDRPQEGIIHVSQDVMVRLQKSMAGLQP